jgi:hypothetical protein
VPPCVMMPTPKPPLRLESTGPTLRLVDAGHEQMAALLSALLAADARDVTPFGVSVSPWQASNQSYACYPCPRLDSGSPQTTATAPNPCQPPDSPPGARPAFRYSQVGPTLRRSQCPPRFPHGRQPSRCKPCRFGVSAKSCEPTVSKLAKRPSCPRWS